MARIRRDFQSGILAAALTAGDTTITFAEAPGFPTLGAEDYVPIALDAQEVVHLTDYTAGATTGTISRGEEGSTAAPHDSGAPWRHGILVADVEATVEVEQELYVGDYVSTLTSTSGYATKGNLCIPTRDVEVRGLFAITDEPSSVDLRFCVYELNSSWVQQGAALAVSDLFSGPNVETKIHKRFSSSITLLSGGYYAIQLQRTSGSALRMGYVSSGWGDDRAGLDIQKGYIRIASNNPSDTDTWQRGASDSMCIGAIVVG